MSVFIKTSLKEKMNIRKGGIFYGYKQVNSIIGNYFNFINII